MRRSLPRRGSPGAALLALAAALAACQTVRARPGLTLPIGEPARDPDPTRNPADSYAIPDAAEAPGAVPGAQCRPRPLEEVAAVLLGIVAGGGPLLEVIGTFDENALVGDRRPAAAAKRCGPARDDPRGDPPRTLDWMPEVDPAR